MNVFFFWMTQNIGGGCKIVGNIQDTYPLIMLEKKNHQFLTGKHPKHYQYFSLLIFFTVLKKRLKVLQLSAVQQLLKHAGLCHQFHNILIITLGKLRWEMVVDQIFRMQIQT